MSSMSGNLIVFHRTERVARIILFELNVFTLRPPGWSCFTLSNFLHFPAWENEVWQLLSKSYRRREVIAVWPKHKEAFVIWIFTPEALLVVRVYLEYNKMEQSSVVSQCFCFKVNIFLKTLWKSLTAAKWLSKCEKKIQHRNGCKNVVKLCLESAVNDG